MELYPHQKDAVEKLRNGSILWGRVGIGKSLAAVAYYMKVEAPKHVFVITTAKKRDSLDWEKEFASYGVGKAKNATVAGVLTVDSWNNLKKYMGVKNGFFVFDEQRLVGSGAWTKSFIKIAKHNTWILLSATPGDTWLDYIPVFVANGFYKNRTAFKLEHVVYASYTRFPKVERYTGVGKLVRLRNSILVEMPYARHTVRKSKNVLVDYDKELFEKVLKRRWHVYENRPIKNVAELFYVMRKVVNSDSSRLSAIHSLMEKHPKLIVFYNFDYELEILRTLADPENLKHTQISSTRKMTENSNSFVDIRQTPAQSLQGVTTKVAEFIPTTLSHPEKNSKSSLDPSQTLNGNGSNSSVSEIPSHQNRSITTNGPSKMKTVNGGSSGSQVVLAEWNGHKHEEIPGGDNWVYLVQYVAGSEGWNCVETDAMVFYSLTYSYKNFHQAHGRIDRLNTLYTELFYYVLKSNSIMDKAVSKSLSGKRSFNEAQFISKI